MSDNEEFLLLVHAVINSDQLLRIAAEPDMCLNAHLLVPVRNEVLP